MKDKRVSCGHLKFKRRRYTSHRFKKRENPERRAQIAPLAASSVVKEFRLLHAQGECWETQRREGTALACVNLLMLCFKKSTTPDLRAL